MTVLTPEEKLCRQIQDYCDDRDISTVTFGVYAMNDGKFFGRLKSGSRTWPETRRKARIYMRDNPAPDRFADQNGDRSAGI